VRGVYYQRLVASPQRMRLVNGDQPLCKVQASLEEIVLSLC
jgi:thymidylate kinase